MIPTDALNRRCALFTLLAMTLAIAMGLLAWGPILPQSDAHQFADMRSLFGLANGVNAAFCLPMLAAGVWGWRAVRRSPWPDSLQTPWRWCFACITATAGSAVAYHLAPGDRTYLVAQAAVAGSFSLLLCSFLAERVHAGFGSHRACATALGVAALAATLSSLAASTDLRPLLLLQLLPVLLIPAGALSLPGHHTRQADWLLVLGLYALARVSDLSDDSVLLATGGAISGHALMHLCMAGVAAWLAYRAGSASTEALPEATDSGPVVQANTSLSTSG
ncbi:MAG: hypothetical protein H7Z15_01805 [Rhizobacter sp.]|nr:hypothetical protein [Rhizobacter sp.]